MSELLEKSLATQDEIQGSFPVRLPLRVRMTASGVGGRVEEEDGTPFDKLREECGVMAVYNHSDAARLTYWGLYALQHRGQESAGIVTSDGLTSRAHKAMGSVAEIFTTAPLT